MVIFKPALLSTPAAAASDYPRILYNTLTRGLASSSVVASSEDPAGPKDAPLRPDSWEFWKPTALPATWEVSFGGIKRIDSVGIAGHDFGSKQASVKVELGLGGSYTTFGEVAPADDSAMLFLGDSQLATSLKITVSGVSEIPSMAVVYVGESLVMQRTVYGGHAPMTMNRQTALTQSMSEGGQFLGQSAVSHGLSGKASFRFLTAAWVRENLDPFIVSAQLYPFFFAWRPSSYPREIAYAWRKGDIVPTNMGKRDFMQVDLSMAAIGNA